MLQTFVRSAFRAGSLRGVRVRESTHSPTGVVVVCYFTDHARAGGFAARWARRLGYSVFVRSAWRHGLWSVSLPVAGCVPFASYHAGKRQLHAWPVRGLRTLGPVIQSAGRSLL